jgi:hypothetical protein
MDDYASRLKAATDPFVYKPTTIFTIESLKAVVEQTQNAFLMEHPNYVAHGIVAVRDQGGGRFYVNAPVCTYWEKAELDRKAAQAAELVKQLRAETEAIFIRSAKQAANLRRQHRRLMRRHEHRITSSTKAIWPTLSVGQQYAILKDIDYAVRHSARFG